MKSFLNFFSQIKWYEYACLSVIYAVIITLAIVFKSNVFIVLHACFGVATVFSIAKGFVVANFFGIAQVSIYCVLCAMNKYWGEIVVCVGITIPTYIASAISWLKNRSSNDSVVKIDTKISLKEWLLILIVVLVGSIGIFFMLQAFDTSNLILSTLSVVFTGVAGYLLARRSEYNYVFLILMNLICFSMWIMVMLAGDKQYMTTLFVYVVYICINSYGMINWFRMKKKQSIENSDV